MKLRNFSIIASLGLMASLCLTPTAAEGVLASVKSIGMAAAVIAYPQDAEAAAYNPAGMADVGDRVDIGVEWARESRRHARVHGNLSPVGVNGGFHAARTRDFYNADFGINKQLPCNATIGFVLYNRNFNKTTYKNPFPLLGTTKLGLEYVHETMSTTFAIKVWEKHNFGISLNHMIQRLKVNGIQNFDNPLFSSHPGHVTNREYSYAHGWGYTLGYRGQLCNWLSVGVTFQPRTHMSRFTKYSGFMAQRGRVDIPRKIGAGIAIRFLPCATVAFDYENIQWTRVKALNNPLASNLIVDKLGTSHGSGFGFHDQNYYRLGVDYDLYSDLTIRAGYRHANTPTRRTQTAVNLLLVDTIEDYITLGATYSLPCCQEISIVYAHGFNHKVKGRNSIPLTLGGGNVDLDEDNNVLGLSWGWNY
jgi:long-chain fatty acid transport protein